jgi:hypothetical protein
MSDKPVICEAEAEKLADARVQRRLSTDSAYRNAENAEDQSKREAQIEDEIWADIECKYEIVRT